MAKRSMPGPDAEKPKPAAGRSDSTGADHRFDVWLQRRLRQMFDGVAEKPLPKALRDQLLGRGEKNSK